MTVIKTIANVQIRKPKMEHGKKQGDTEPRSEDQGEPTGELGCKPRSSAVRGNGG